MHRHSIEHRVRYDECDPMGYVHHSIYLQYFEMGRTELLRASGGSYRALEDADLLVVVVRVDCRYQSPARYDDLIEIHTELRSITPAKIVHAYRVTRDETELVKADVTMAMVNREGKLQRIPDEIINTF